MSYYPIFVDLRGKKILIVGGGAVAQRKIETLLAYEALPYLVARQLTPRLDELVKEAKVTFLGEAFSSEYLEGVFMVIAATDDSHLNREVSALAQEKGLLVNAVDQPSDCNFIVPSVLKRGDLTIAVSTSGKSPALARRVREDLESHFGLEYGFFLNLMGHLRKEILGRGLPQKENKRIFEKLVDSDVLVGIKTGDWQQVADLLTRVLEREFTIDDVQHYLKDG